MKTIIFACLLFLIYGCSSKAENQGLGIIKTVPTNDFIVNFSEDYKINLLLVDTRNPIIYDDKISTAKKVFNSFGKSLMNTGLVLNFDLYSKETGYIYSRRVFDKLQNNLNTNYTYNDAPFLVLYKKDKEKYIPEKILSFSSIPDNCLESSLSILEQKLFYRGKGSSHDFIKDIKINELTCLSSDIAEKKLGLNIQNLLGYLKRWIQEI